MPKTTKTFDKSAYDKKYHQEKYKQLTTVFTKAEAEEVEQAAKAAGMTKSAYMKRAILDMVERDGF